jgi:endonuclease YncB( thermonuclease family)
MRLLPVLVAVIGLGIRTEPSHAASCQLSPPEHGTIAQVKDAETLELTDGTMVRLIGAKTPQAPLGWRGADPWPFVQEAKDTVTSLAMGADVELRFGGNQTDRHGYKLAQVFVVKGGTPQWLQQELVKAGLALVYSFPDNRACAAELLTLEAEARAAKRGIWNSWAYRVLDASDAERIARLSHSYQLVEGVVAEIGEVRGRLYLNFTQDWRTDFTIAVEPKDVASFTAAGLDLKSLKGKRVRVRGWLEWRNGPMIVADHPEQIELLPEVKKTAGPAGEEPRNAGRLDDDR